MPGLTQLEQVYLNDLFKKAIVKYLENKKVYSSGTNVAGKIDSLFRELHYTPDSSSPAHQKYYELILNGTDYGTTITGNFVAPYHFIPSGDQFNRTDEWNTQPFSFFETTINFQHTNSNTLATTISNAIEGGANLAVNVTVPYVNGGADASVYRSNTVNETEEFQLSHVNAGEYRYAGKPINLLIPPNSVGNYKVKIGNRQDVQPCVDTYHITGYVIFKLKDKKKINDCKSKIHALAVSDVFDLLSESDYALKNGCEVCLENDMIVFKRHRRPHVYNFGAEFEANFVAMPPVQPTTLSTASVGIMLQSPSLQSALTTLPILDSNALTQRRRKIMVIPTAEIDVTKPSTWPEDYQAFCRGLRSVAVIEDNDNQRVILCERSLLPTQNRLASGRYLPLPADAMTGTYQLSRRGFFAASTQQDYRQSVRLSREERRARQQKVALIRIARALELNEKDLFSFMNSDRDLKRSLMRLPLRTTATRLVAADKKHVSDVLEHYGVLSSLRSNNTRQQQRR